MAEQKYSIVSSVIGGSSTTLYGCQGCGMVVFDKELHERVWPHNG